MPSNSSMTTNGIRKAPNQSNQRYISFLLLADVRFQRLRATSKTSSTRNGLIHVVYRARHPVHVSYID